MVELPLTASGTYADPFNEITLDVTFTDPAGRQFRVPAFWDGGNHWKVRYASPVVGTHHFHSEFPEAKDAGLHDLTGTVEVKPYHGANLLYVHGPLRVADDHRHFAYADGTPFFWLGDTWWMGLTKRLAWPADVQMLAADRITKGFTVIQIVAGLYPDMPAFDERGANEAGFPWERDYARIRPEYFDAADRRIQFLADQGLVPCVVGAWGYHLPWLGEEKMKQHWRNIIARWGALPVVWCAAGETTMPFYLSKDRAGETARQKKEWTEIIRSMHETDPFHRMITCHPASMARQDVADPTVLDFDMHQSGHGSPAPHHAALALSAWRAQPVMPIVSGEARYEALEIHPVLTAADARQAFWAHLINSGCAGHTYGANGIWQVNRRDQPYGKSPGGNNWGTTPWDDAMRLPGSAQLGAARRLIESLSHWNNLEPHPEWVAAGSPASAPPTLDGAQWIWFPEGEPAKDAPVAHRYFRATFEVPKSRVSPAKDPDHEGATTLAEWVGMEAQLTISADDRCVVWLNGERLGEHADWKHPLNLHGFAAKIHPGANVLAIETENLDPSAHPNPAGLITHLDITFADQTHLHVRTDAAWLSSDTAAQGWQTIGFDASAWKPAKPLGAYGMAPWGRLEVAPAGATPLCAAVDDQLRLIYLLSPGTVRVTALAPTTAYTATWFDPVSGERLPSFSIQPSAAGEATTTTPPGDHDWVLTLIRKSS